MNVKYDAAPHVTGDRWLCLHRNENLFVESVWPSEERARVLATSSFSSYPDPECRALRAALAELYDLDVSNVYVGNGSDEVLSSLLGSLRVRYNTLRSARVGYRMYPVLAARHGFTPEPFTAADLTGVTHGVGRQPALFLIDSPNAITGARDEAGQLTRLREADGESFFIWDNCYGEFAGDEMPRCASNLAVVRTFSKYYGLAGLRVGYGIAPASIVDALHQRKDIYNVSGLAQAAAVEALRRREAFTRARTAMIHAREALTAMLTDLGFSVIPPSGNFVLASHPVVPADVILDALAERCIAVRRFRGIGIDDCLRITVPEAHGLARLGDALKAITSAAAV